MARRGPNPARVPGPQQALVVVPSLNELGSVQIALVNAPAFTALASRDPKDYVEVLLMDRERWLLGYASLADVRRSRDARGCGPAVMQVDTTWAEEGWGPALYDTALLYATRAGASLIPDRMQVSAAAEKIWRTYYDLRPDVVRASLRERDCPLYLVPHLDARYQAAAGFPAAVLDAAVERGDALLGRLEAQGFDAGALVSLMLEAGGYAFEDEMGIGTGAYRPQVDGPLPAALRRKLI